jgi:hypothetical protein
MNSKKNTQYSSAINPKVTIGQFFVADNSCISSSSEGDVGTLFEASKGLEPYDLQLSALDLSIAFPGPGTLAGFLYQAKRVQEADLNYPIIQAPEGWIMDGLHRVVKAILEGKTTIKAVKLKVLPKPDRKNKED